MLGSLGGSASGLLANIGFNPNRRTGANEVRCLWEPFSEARSNSRRNAIAMFLMITGLGLAGKGGLSAAALAVTFYVCPLTPLVLVLPCAYLSFTQRASTRKATEQAADEQDGYRYVRSIDQTAVELNFLPYLAGFTFMVIVLFSCLLGASAAIMDGELQFLEASFLAVVAVRDLTPNVGVFWYLFIEVFDRYRLLYLVAFHGQLLFYPVPLHLRLGRHKPTGPFIHCAIAIGMVTLFKPYPTASDFAFMLSVMLVQSEIIRESEKFFAFCLSGVLFGLSMFPTMSAVWLGRNTGNANYLYNMVLVVNVFGCLLLSEFVKAAIRLRRRKHLGAFCRKVVLEIADEVAADAVAAKAKSAAWTRCRPGLLLEEEKALLLLEDEKAALLLE
ncbi:unnamed protein product [Polarella glacialis]|uniref:Uncharacterized protein n=1 Tax=Polarella glacialis TaxID=89957 RepID=A0A813KXK8_POLGL|nr:unnamed protein product [Polarella glacialis]